MSAAYIRVEPAAILNARLRGTCYGRGNDSLPLVIWKRFNQIFPDDLRGYGNLITSWTARGHANIEEMIHTYDDWLSRTPQDTALRMTFRNFCLNLGNAYFKNTELKDAARFYVKAIQIDPYYPNAHNNLGSVYAQEGNIDQAVVQFQQAISLNPLYGEALYNLGNAYSDKGDAKLAQSFYQKAAQLNVEAAKELLKKPEKSP